MSGRVYVVTGAGSGLGAATAARLAALPGTQAVFALDRRWPVTATASGAAAVPDLEPASDSRVVRVPCDVTNDDSVDAAAVEVASALGDAATSGHTTAPSPGVDAVIHCAGVNRGGPLSEMSPADLEATFAVNCVGVVRVHRALFPLLLRARGVTVVLSSEIALAGAASAFTGPYAASKVALEALATALRQELAMLDPPMSVVVVNPGACRTPMLAEAVRTNFDAQSTRAARGLAPWAGAGRRPRATCGATPAPPTTLPTPSQRP